MCFNLVSKITPSWGFEEHIFSGQLVQKRKTFTKWSFIWVRKVICTLDSSACTCNKTETNPNSLRLIVRVRHRLHVFNLLFGLLDLLWPFLKYQLSNYACFGFSTPIWKTTARYEFAYRLESGANPTSWSWLGSCVLKTTPPKKLFQRYRLSFVGIELISLVEAKTLLLACTGWLNTK